jgi:hypothetical protein
MSKHEAFRRVAVSPQVAQQMQTITMPAPTRGIIQNENEAYMQPGAAVICDNWKPTMKGVSLRGGCALWVDLHAQATAPAWKAALHSYTSIDEKATDTADGSVWAVVIGHISNGVGKTFAQMRATLPAGTWVPTTRDLPPWANSHAYSSVGEVVYDVDLKNWWRVLVDHTAAATGTFAADRTAHPTYWVLQSSPRLPLISGFEYNSGIKSEMYVANVNAIYNVTTTIPTTVASGRNSGNYAAAQLANQGGDWLVAVNDAGDAPLRYNGTTWASLLTTTPLDWVNNAVYAVNARVRDATDGSRWKCAIAHTSPAGPTTFASDRATNPARWTFDLASDGSAWIIGPPGTPIENGANLTYVCKYRGRYFFVEKNSMNAWYLPLNAVGGSLSMIPLSGAASEGGRLLFCASWSIDAGDGIDDKICFVTDKGEALIFTGGDPSSPTNWRQEGRYKLSPPLGMNAHLSVGGDLLVATVDGVLPMSGAITKDRAELELAAVTRSIKPMWRAEVLDKREFHWTMCKWDEYGAIFTTFPGGLPGKYRCLVTNAATGAHTRFTGWDAMFFVRMRGDMFFGTQDGRVMQADRTGYDNGVPYVATLVGGWEMFQSPSQTVTWRQSRASFAARNGEPFQPQLSATTDYIVTLPPPPFAAPDPGVLDLWDQGKWGPDLGINYGKLWTQSRAYTVGNRVFGLNFVDGFWDCAVAHTSAASGTFAADRAAHPTYWTYANPQPAPPTPTQAERNAYAQWDQPTPAAPVVRNTMWVSIGMTGYSHAPVVQVTVAQQAKPEVDLISIAATFERAGINV